MSRSIDERIVEMRFDNKQFESGVKTTMDSLERLKKSLNLEGAQKGFSELDSASKKCDFSGLQSAVENVSMKFSAMEVVAITALMNITNKAVDAGLSLAKSLTLDQVTAGWNKYAEKTSSVQTIMAATRTSWEEEAEAVGFVGSQMEYVEEQLGRLNWFTDETSYNFLDMVNNIGKFTSNGIGLSDATTQMQGIATWAALSGANTQEASRAMYNLAQAMSVGAVKLIDWKSIENANMATVEFKQTAIETAAELGTLTEVGEGLYETLDGNEVSVRNFNAALSDGWFNAEVLEQTLQQYGGYADMLYEASEETGLTATNLLLAAQDYEDGVLDLNKLSAETYDETTRQQVSVKRLTELLDGLTDGTYDLGRRAFQAAQEAKTFQEAIDATKDAVSTGWMNIFENIFGNYEEAKKLWTDVSNELYDIFAAPLEGVNNLLRGWKLEGGRDALFAGLSAGWNNLKDILSEIGDVWRTVFPKDDMDVRISNLVALTNRFKEFMENLKPSESTMTNLKNTLQGVFSVMKVGGQVVSGLGRVFGALVSAVSKITGAFLGISGDVGLVVSSFMEMISASGIIEGVFDRIVSAIDALATGFSHIIEIVTSTINAFSGGGGLSVVAQGLLDILWEVAATIVDVFGALTGIDTSTTLFKFVQFFERFKASVSDFISSNIDSKLSKIGEVFKGFIDSVRNFASTHFKMPDLSGFSSGIDTLKEKTQPLKTIGDVFKAVFNGIIGVLSAALPIIKGIASAIGEALGAIFSRIKDVFTGEGDGLVNLIAGGGLAALFIKLSDVIGTFKKSIGGFSDFFSGLKDAILDTFSSIQNNLNAKALMEIAKAIALLAGSLVVLSLIDPEKMGSSLAAISALFVELTAVMYAMKKMSGGATSNKGPLGFLKDLTDRMQSAIDTAGIVAMATGILILAGALKVISTVDTEKLLPAVAAIGGLLAELTGSSLLLSNFSGTAKKGAAGMIAMAGAIYILSMALEKISQIRFTSMIKGLGGVITLMGSLAGLSWALSKTGGLSVNTGLGMIAIATSMLIFGKAIDQIGHIDLPVLAKGLVGIATALLSVALATKLMPAGSDMIGSGIGMIAIGAALNLFVRPIREIGSLNLPVVAKGVGAIAVSMISIGAAMKLMPSGGSMIGIGLGLIAVAAAINLMVGPIQAIGNMRLANAAQGVIAIGGALLVLAGGLHLMKGTIGGATALVIAAAGLNAIVPPIRALGMMNIGAIVKALVTMAATLGMLAMASIVARPIALLGAALLTVGVAVLSVGAGVALLAAGLTALSLAGTAAVTMLVASLEILIVGLLNVIAHSATAFKNAFVALIKAGLQAFTETTSMAVEVILTFVDELLGSLAEHVPSIVDSLVTLVIGIIDALANRMPELVLAAMRLIGGFFQAVVDAIKEIDTASLVNGIAAVGLMTALTYALAGVVSILPAAMAGVLGVGVLIAELSLVLAAIGKLNQIPGLQEMAASGGDLLATVGNAIGKFVGSIIGGLAEGFTNSLPNIADNLSDFAERIQPFVQNMQNIDSGIVEATGTLCSAMLMLSGTQFVDGILNFLGISTSMDEFGDKLVTFGKAIKKYGKKIAGLDASLISESAIAGKALVELASSIPNTGGLVSFITGDNDMGKFGDQLVKFGEAMTEYNNAISGVEPAVILASANAGKALVELAGSIPNTGGLVSFITGDNDMVTFGAQLVIFGQAMTEYNDAVKGVKAKVIEASVTAGKALIELANTVPNTGGLVSFITGDNDMGKFGSQLVIFGEAMSEYCKAVEGVTAEAVTASIEAGQMLIELANTIPTTGGLFSFFTGSNDMSKFGQQLLTFGQYLKQYADAVSGISSEQISGVVDGLMRLIDFANAATGVDTSGMTGFGQAMQTMAQNGIDQMLNAFTDAVGRTTEAANSIITALVNAINTGASQLQNAGKQAADKLMTAMIAGLNAKKGLLLSTAGNICTNLIQKVRTMLPVNTFNQIAQNNVMQALINGLNSKKALLLSTAGNICTSLIQQFRTSLPSNTFNQIGQNNVMQALINGLNAKKSALLSTAGTICSELINKFQTSLPADTFKTLGQNIIQALINGMNDEKGAAQQAARDICTTVYQIFQQEFTAEKFKPIGQAAAQGLADGIVSKINEIRDAAIRAAREAIQAAKNELQSNSPSKVFFRIGEDVDRGMAYGIISLLSLVADAGTQLGDESINAMQQAMNQISEIATDELDIQPTIRPVLDLTEIQNGAADVYSLFNGGLNTSSAYRRATSFSGSLFDSDSENGLFTNGRSMVVNNSFTQNNYSPTALSRKDIYRQTRNQFAAMRGAVNMA